MSTKNTDLTEEEIDAQFQKFLEGQGETEDERESAEGRGSTDEEGSTFEHSKPITFSRLIGRFMDIQEKLGSLILDIQGCEATLLKHPDCKDPSCKPGPAPGLPGSCNSCAWNQTAFWKQLDKAYNELEVADDELSVYVGPC